MNAASWRTSRTVQGLDLYTGHTVTVVDGLIETATGSVQVALQVGDYHPVLLTLQDAHQHALNVNEATAERLRLAAEALGDDQP